MKKLAALLSVLCFLPEFAFSAPGQEPEQIQGPWFTGPLLTPSGYTIPQGHVNLEPYLYVNNTIGKYDGNWSTKSASTFTSTIVQLPFFVGLTSFMDLQMFPQVQYNHVKDQNHVGFSDLPIALNFQVWKEHPGSYAPAVRVGIAETFPTGKYQKLNSTKLGTDIMGEGVYATAFSTVFSKTFGLGGSHYLRTRVAFNYSISSSVHVKGYNTYGGDETTKGKVIPGNQFSAMVGLEYTPTLHWAFALDIRAVTANKDRFSGISSSQFESGEGNTSPQTNVVSIGDRSLEQFSLAPAVEYNFSENIGMIVGAWFTVAGRNTAQFVNGVAAVNLYF